MDHLKMRRKKKKEIIIESLCERDLPPIANGNGNVEDDNHSGDFEEPETNWRYSLCDMVRHYLFTRCRYPAFTETYIRCHVDKPDTRPEERQAFMDNSTGIRKGKALIIVFVYLSYCIKNLYVAYETFNLIDYDNLEDNVKLISDGHYNSGLNNELSTDIKSSYMLINESANNDTKRLEIVRQISCLATNCSRLSAAGGALAAHERHHNSQLVTSELSRFAGDFVKLPIFRLCHPKLDAWYSPVTTLDSMGVLIFLATAFNAFLLGSWITIQQLVFPARDEMIMFIVVPRVTARMAWRRTRELLSNVSISYANYCLNSKLRFFTQTEQDYLPHTASLIGGLGKYGELQPSLEDTPDLGAPNSSAPCTLLRSQQQQFSAPISHHHTLHHHNHHFKVRSQREIESMANECLPIIRTRWWRRVIANIFLSILQATVSQIMGAGVLAFIYITPQLTRKRDLLISYAREMRHQDCQLWLAANSSHQSGQVGQRQVIDLSDLNIKWSSLHVIEGAAFNIMPAMGVSMMFAYYWAIVSEIEIWLAELRSLMVASLVVARLRFSQASGLINFSLTGGGQYLMDSDCASNYSSSLSTSSTVTFSSSPPPSSTAQVPHSTTNRYSTAPSANPPTRIETRHFYNMKYLRQHFQEETSFFLMNYFSRITKYSLNKLNGTLERAKEPSIYAINSKLNDKNREAHFVELAMKQSRQKLLQQQQQQNNQPHCHHRRNETSLFLILNQRAGHHYQEMTNQTEDEDDLTHDIGTLEQVYVNFRLFIEHVRGLTPSMGVVLAVTYGLNYGLVCICVFCSRKMPDLRREFIFIITFGWIVSNVLIVLAANFHANAKKLQPLMWSLIAQLTFSQDDRLRHLRFLWLKQVQILDNEGGIALNAFRLRVTYVNIIQIIIWTVTILVWAIKS